MGNPLGMYPLKPAEKNDYSYRPEQRYIIEYPMYHTERVAVRRDERQLIAVAALPFIQRLQTISRGSDLGLDLVSLSTYKRTRSIRSSAVWIVLLSVAYENRTYPSPASPKTAPGTAATPASSMRYSTNFRLSVVISETSANT